jgi:hypothetical protein
MPSYPGFVGPSYQSQSYLADAERCINRFPEKNESETAPTPWALLQAPGFALVCAPTPNFGAGMFSESGRTFFVTGFTLYELTAGDVATARGVIARDGNPVTFMSNGAAGHQLALTSGNQFYVLDLNTNAFTTPVVLGATMCGFLDGFGVILDAASSTLQVTAFEDFNTISTAILQRTAGSDPWKSLYVVNRLIYALGEHTSDVLYDAGTSPFPFAPIQEAFMQTGTAATYSGARLDKSLIWLSHNEQGKGQIVSVSGYTAGRISTHAIEASIATYGDLSDAVAFSYQENGHTFYVLTFPSAERTWVFDQATGLFHERLYWDTTNAAWLAYRAMFFASDLTRNLVQDRLTGAIYRMSTTLFTDVDGAAIRRLRQPPRLSFDQKRFTTHAIQLVMDVGQGLSLGQGSDPQIMRQTSKDGGQTWSNEYWASAGAIGAYDTRVRWTQCGQARNRVDRFIDTDPVASRFVDCLIDVTVGTS